jgi:hypothetical protein
MEFASEPIPPTRTLEAGDLRAQVLALVGHLDALFVHLAKRPGADADLLRRLSTASADVEFTVRHRASVDPVVVREACRAALALLEERRRGPAILLHARARAACRVLVRALSDAE